MIHNEKKITKIIEELTLFFISLNGTDISSQIQITKSCSYLTLKSNFDIKYLHKVEKMESFLSGNQNDGLEDIYWELAGAGEPGEGNQLLLIGMMIDSASIKIKNNTVTIYIEKKM